MAALRMRLIAILRVPFSLAFQKQDLVASLR